VPAGGAPPPSAVPIARCGCHPGLGPHQLGGGDGGVALCFLYQIDVVALVGLNPAWQPGAFIVTGLLIGRGSNFVHDFVKRYLAEA
jgi:hypothetical protein